MGVIESFLPFRFVRLQYQALYALALILRQAPSIVAIPGQMQQQPAGGAVEHAVHEIADHRTDDLLPRPRRPVDIGTVHLGLLEVALVLENLHHRHHRRVGDGALLAEGLVHVSHGGFVELAIPLS